MVEQWTENPCVGSSILPSTTKKEICFLQISFFVVLKHRSYRGLRPQTPASFQDDPPCGLVMLQAFLFVVLKHRSYRGLRPQTPAAVPADSL